MLFPLARQMDPAMAMGNRVQRRASAKKKPEKAAPSKGFGKK